MPTDREGVAVRVDGVVKHFGDVHALDGVTFEVAAGTVLGLLGPNGAGKTTAVRVLNTVLRPDAGRATVAGFDVVAQPHEVRRRIGLAGQYAAIDEHLTGRENLRLVGRLSHLSRGDADRRADELLADFSLTDAADRTAKTYSGGMRRRLDLAAALVAHPPVVLLDEPTTGLDPASRIDLWNVIEQLVADGTSVLLTTQYLEEADRLADRIVVIDHGRVVAEGTPNELKRRIGETTIHLTFADPATADRAVSVLGDLAVTRPVADPLSINVPLLGGPARVRDVLNRLGDARVEPHNIDLHAPTLDDVFLALTRSGA